MSGQAPEGQIPQKFKMAKKEEAKKIVLERTYNVPLRKEYMKAPRWKRTPRAVKALKEFVAKHMKATEVKVGKYANKELWKHGIKNPPHHIKVDVAKDEDGIVAAELVGAPKDVIEEPQKRRLMKKLAKEKKAEKKEAPKKEKQKTEEEKKGEKLEEVVEEKKEEKQEEAKKIEKEEIKELKKEHPKVHAPKQPAVEKKVEQRPNAPVNR